MTDKKEITLSILVNNHFGVLTKIAGMFSRRGVNITALSVGETHNPAYSRLTIHAIGDAVKLQQVYSQLPKLEDVVRVSSLSPQTAYKFGIVLAKLKPMDKLERLHSLASRHGASLQDISGGCVMLKALGSVEELERLTTALEEFGLIELATSGPVALDTNPHALDDEDL